MSAPSQIDTQDVAAQPSRLGLGLLQRSTLGSTLTPAGLMRAAMAGSGEEHGFTHIPRRARWWFNLLTWRRHGFALTRTLLVVRHGRLRRSFQALQHELETLARRKSALEDVELEIMERAEGLRDLPADECAQREEGAVRDEELLGSIDEQLAKHREEEEAAAEEADTSRITDDHQSEGKHRLQSDEQ